MQDSKKSPKGAARVNPNGVGAKRAIKPGVNAWSSITHRVLNYHPSSYPAEGIMSYDVIFVAIKAG